MPQGIKLSSRTKITRSATVHDNANVRRTLQTIERAIAEGRMDSILTLRTYDVIDLHREDGVKHAAHRTMSFAEIDAAIAKARETVAAEVKFAHQQMGLFSQYLNAKVDKNSAGGYTAEMILKFIPNQERQKLIDIIIGELTAIEKSDFKEGEYNNLRGQPESKYDRLDRNLERSFQEDN
jgi:hypothetical protein